MGTVYIKNIALAQSGVNAIINISYEGTIESEVILLNVATSAVIATATNDLENKILSFTVNESFNGSFFDVKIGEKIIYNFKFNFFTHSEKLKSMEAIDCPIYDHIQYFETVSLNSVKEELDYIPPDETIRVDGEDKKFGNLQNLDYDRGFSEGLLIGQMI